MVTVHHNTPTVAVLDNRGQAVSNITYHRHPDSPHVTEARITRYQADARGRITRSSDPRLYAAGRTNFISQYDLNGNLLRSDGADNGTTVTLNDAAGRPLIMVSNMGVADDGTVDARQAVTRTWQYEPASLPGRPLGVTEQRAGDVARIIERFVYAGNTDAEKALNLAGVCISHYDTAGLVQTDSVALTGVPLAVTRHLLQGADNPDTVVDWQGEDVSAWNDRLATESFTTLTTTDATGATLTTTDAKGHMQRVTYDIAGLLSGSWLTLKGGTEQVVVKSLAYSAAGQKLREEHGNGVVTTYTYEPETQRLTGIKTERPAGHASGTKVLQDQRYEYDAVGNILSVHNDAEVTRFWRNQKVVPEQTYRYDSLYQLVSATGREMANIGQQSSNLPALSSFDNATYTNYTRLYTYDSAGNLTQIRHSAPATNNNYTTNITVSSRSNRGVLSSLTENPAEVDALFTAGGQQTQLQPGQQLTWTPRNELLKVIPVTREGNASDRESYRYAADSQRILKVSTQKTNSSEQRQQAVYLPGLELRTTSNGDTPIEQVQVVTAGEAGNAQVRLLVWEKGRPDGIDNGVMRYGYDNLTGSSQLELDASGNIISQEEYYPYGGTAIWAARSQAEAGYKTIRYSGKERDATGLYYYGYRYYQPWAGRWLSADPAGTVDGLNLFRMVMNNPVTCEDKTGEATHNRNRNIFRLATFGLRRKNEGIGASLSRGMKVTRAIAGGIAVAGIAGAIALTGGAALGVIATVGVGAFVIGAIAGWNINKITTGIASFLAKRLQGKSVAANTAAGVALGSSTAHLTGARIQGTAIAGVAGGVSGAIGGAISNSDRGMGGAHAAGVAVGTVDTIAGRDVSYAMEITSATFGAIGGFITGTQGSSAVGENAGYGSYIGGMTGRYADNAVSYAFNMVGRAVVRRGVQEIVTHYAGNNFLTRFLGRRLGGTVFSLLRRNISIGGSNEWTGSGIGAAVGGIGTALGIAAPDAHFRNRVNQLGGIINTAGGYLMNQLRDFVLPAAARDVAIDAGGTAVRLARQGVSFV
ncbi:RHS repeat protein [Serratia marcescens]|uniref:RHS repeat domain-containing protein n=1 Tax=Serratia marcescens TaxID=615 RepID=UPI00175F3B0C|nr:RHS repeat domain-containing protein [Serratia marcescens]MCK1089149.1 RHS repeat protein [Serratia marcescens]MCT4802709.1 RHS repeat protein [Serratia marcescens]QLJ25101.1 RHS repeat protein [Serratia marcescens]QLJ28823.1 RHS repeat protein [Serratia marcescens]QLJ29771.1 RHS repeat protein [Serratia marcescens]